MAWFERKHAFNKSYYFNYLHSKADKMNFDRESYINQPLDIEPELCKLFGKNDNLVVFEIGACEGEDSIKYARLFTNAVVYAFEPLPDNVDLIADNLKRYNVQNVKYYNKALSKSKGISEFHVSGGRPADAVESDWNYGNKSSSLLPPAKHLELVDFIHFTNKITVDTSTIKDFCDEHQINHIDFIHMDVQGAELMVLEGAGDCIKAIKAIWLEVSKVDLYKGQPLADDVKRFMHDNNFVLVKDSLKQQLQGDQLYISQEFFPNHAIIFPPDSLYTVIKKKAAGYFYRIRNRFFGASK